MTGWLGDFFRFWWALFYWNTRKAWFRLRGAHRDDCPCQTYSDSGLALDARCEAVTQWRKPARFRRVCPLLTETAQGWRCGADAERVRPFWGRAALYASAALLALYLTGTLAVYTLLRVSHYDAGYLMVAWPPRWPELRASQEKLYARRAQQALQSGNYPEAILALEIVNRLNPMNYPAGLALASLSQAAGRPSVASHIYERLMNEVPEQRGPTARIWFRYLLAQADYAAIKPLATTMLTEDSADRVAWLNALLFAARQTGDPDCLGAVVQAQPHLPDWCIEILGDEELLLQGNLPGALPRLTSIHNLPATVYLPYYQIDRLLRHDQADQANALLDAYRRQLPPDEAGFLQLRVYQAKAWSSLVRPEFERLFQYELSPRIVAQMCAYLISHPDPDLALLYAGRFMAGDLPVNATTAPLYHASYLAAVLSGDTDHATAIIARLTQHATGNARALQGLGELLRGKAGDPRLGRILPLVPLPTEVIYAILEGQSAPAK